MGFSFCLNELLDTSFVSCAAAVAPPHEVSGWGLVLGGSATLSLGDSEELLSASLMLGDSELSASLMLGDSEESASLMDGEVSESEMLFWRLESRDMREPWERRLVSRPFAESRDWGELELELWGTSLKANRLPSSPRITWNENRNQYQS